ncbi:N-acetyl-gamma-glutamyl-phosphate reductase [Candidatus Margulisiibacteriota bacterium]
MKKVGIVGVTGYTGQELAKLLFNHPEIEVCKVFSKTYANSKLKDICPNFYFSDLNLEAFQPGKPPKVDLLFLALPHGQSHSFMKDLMSASLKIVDLAADFRLKDSRLFKKYYEIEHKSSEIFDKFSLGFPELFKSRIKATQGCANPGCYSTSVILGLYPLAEKKLLADNIIIDAKSGVSGAGKALKAGSLFCEANENVKAYSTFNHRHMAEMESVLGVPVCFSPHLIPMNRGILASMYIDNPHKLTEKDVQEIYQEKYQAEPFINLNTDPAAVSTKYVLGSNLCQITVKVVSGTSKIVIFSAIDNLLKGAAGQAVQNMNIMLDFPETLGLPEISL